MGNATLNQVQNMVDHLTPLDQARLLAYLSSRMTRIVTSIYSATLPSTSGSEVEWSEFFRIGDALAAGDRPESPTLTAAVLTMRR
jgi:hypothetical protein